VVNISLNFLINKGSYKKKTTTTTTKKKQQKQKEKSIAGYCECRTEQRATHFLDSVGLKHK